jgi:uncharacterized protein YjbI with pentapeptide repeats
LLIALLAAACGSNSSPSPSPSQATPQASRATSAGDLPAGVQFLAPAVVLPSGFSGAAVAFGGKSLYFGTASGALAITSGSGTAWTTTTIDDGHDYAPPTGLPYLMVPGIEPGPTVTTPTGIVVAGNLSFSDVSATTGTHTTRESALWFSPDAVHWTMFDPRGVLGGSGMSVTLSDVSTDKNGFIAVGTVAASTNVDKTQIVVLRSSDGLKWSLSSTFGSTWSVESGSLLQFKGDLLLSGREYVCAADASSHSSFGVGAQIRLWRSSDAGATWTAVDLTAAEPVIHIPNPAPADASTCPKAGDLQAIDTKYAGTGFLLGVFDDNLVAISKDKATVSVTSDLKTWHSAVLPDRNPVGKANGSMTQLLTSESTGWIYRSFEPLRDSSDKEEKVGYQIRWWRSTDSGATWTAGTPGKPMVAGGAFVTFVPHADGTVEMVTAPMSASGQTATTAVRSSTAGPAVDWMHCVAAANADCSFASVVTTKSGTTDLRGVNLSAATWTGATMPGADFTGAYLYSAALDGDFTGANFAKDIMSGGTYSGTFDGANLAGVGISSSALAGSWSKANFAGAFLTDAKISAKLDQASFKGARLDTAVFSNADLTGADFSGASAAGVTFDKATVTCPDGKPSDPKATGFAACRIKP